MAKPYSLADIDAVIAIHKAEEGRDLERYIVTPEQFADLLAECRPFLALIKGHTDFSQSTWIQYNSVLILKGP